MVGSAPNDRLCSIAYASKGELFFKISGLAENMQAKNSSILPTPAKPTAGRRGSALEMGNRRFDIDVYRDGTLIVTTPNDGSYIDSTADTGRARYTYQVCEAGTQTSPMRRQ